MAWEENDACAHIGLDAYDAAFNSGFLDGYALSGALPDKNAAATGTLLVSIALSADAFAAAGSRAKAKNGTWQGSGVAPGVLRYARLRNAAGTVVMQAQTVGIAGAAAVTISTGTDVGADYELTCAASHGLVVGQRVTIAGHSHAGANGTWLVSAVMSATVFRITYDAGGASGTGGTSTAANGDLTVTNVTVGVGDTVTVTSFNLTKP